MVESSGTGRQASWSVLRRAAAPFASELFFYFTQKKVERQQINSLH